MAATCPSRMCCCRCGAGFHDLQFHKGFGSTVFHYISYKSILSWSFESKESIYLKGCVDVFKVSCCIHSVACRTVADAVSRLQSSRFRGKVPPQSYSSYCGHQAFRWGFVSTAPGTPEEQGVDMTRTRGKFPVMEHFEFRMAMSDRFYL